MATKLKALRRIVAEVGTVFPDLTPDREIYLAPRIKALPSMSPLEIQVCEDASIYENIEGGCRSEDFIVLVGIFRKYRLDSGERHSKALSDLALSLFRQKELVISVLDGNFLQEPGIEVDIGNGLLTRPLVIKSESGVTEKPDGQLLKIVGFTAGLNSQMGAEYAE